MQPFGGCRLATAALSAASARRASTRRLTVHWAIPVAAFYVAIQWRYVPDGKLFGGAGLVLVQAFGVVWFGMAGPRLIPWKMPDLSYGVYIYHWPVLAYLDATFGLTTLGLPASFVATIAILLPLTLASWYLIEQPALRLKRSLARGRPAADRTVRDQRRVTIVGPKRQSPSFQPAVNLQHPLTRTHKAAEAKDYRAKPIGAMPERLER
jgi:peptidoglycan/LPS O-acetylase OafA/YrhL